VIILFHECKTAMSSTNTMAEQENMKNMREHIDELLLKIKNHSPETPATIADLDTLQNDLLAYIQMKLQTFRSSNAKMLNAEKALKDMTDFFQKSISIIGEVNKAISSKNAATTV
jgi:hypothetical protein